jgi:23S rRNA-intervening sequence protein
MDHEGLPVVQKSYDLALWLLGRTTRFSRDFKFTLGDRIQSTSLDLTLSLVEAAHARARERPLHRASRLLDQLRLLLRLARDVGVLSPRQLEYASGNTEELGRMLGGWLRASKRDHAPLTRAPGDLAP